MAKYKNYNYSQTVMLPVSLKDQLMDGTIEYAIHKLVEEIMDMTGFDAKFKNDETGCKAYNPKILFENNIVGICTWDNSFEENRTGGAKRM